MAQANRGSHADTSNVKSPADSAAHAPAIVTSLKIRQAAKNISGKERIKGSVNTVNVGVSSLKGSYNNQAQRVSAIEKGLSALKAKPITAELALGSSSRFHPVTPVFNNPSIPPVAGSRKFANVFSLSGTITAWGIPLNINYSTDQGSTAAARYRYNSLFKFDFDPARFKNMLQSDMFRYTQLRNNVFGGLELTDYTRKILTSKIVSANAFKNTPTQVALARYIDDPALVSRLILLDKGKIREELMEGVSRRRDSISRKAGNMKSVSQFNADSGGNAHLAADNVKRKGLSLRKIAENKDVAGYFNDPSRIAEIKNLNETQIAAKISSYAAPASKPDYSGLPLVNRFIPVDSVDLNAVIKHQLALRDSADKDVLKQTAHRIFLSSRQNSLTGFTGIMNKQAGSLGQQLNAANEQLVKTPAYAANPNSLGDTAKVALPEITPKQADSLAAVITDIRERLEADGVDVKKMLAAEQLMKHKSLNITELGNSYNESKPTGGLQSLFSKVDNLKLGSYGNEVPGNVQSREIFTTGTHLTFRMGGAPLTVGYGSVNDISSFKDAGFESSIYNQARNITYIGADLLKARGGSLKISLISSFNKDFHNNLYSTPAISSNNVALTISKGLNLGRAGNVDLDVSKTTTLYDNQLHHSSEALLDKKSGLSSNLSNDLFSALSFGFRHQLTIKDLDASDNVYFNYAGMGYQNPANNGFGGARMKFGGSIKKSFYQRKLTFIFRTDMSNMPISYTSNDRWKTYQFQVDSRYQLSRKFNVSIKYINNGTDKKIDNAISPVYGFQKIQVDGNASYKIGKYFTVSHFTVGKQDFSNTNALRGAGNLLMLNYTQTLLLRKNTLTASVFYNRELASYQLIGNLLNSDLTCQYTLFGKIGMSSGVTYLDNTNVVRQAGIRQGFQIFAGSHFDLDTYIDLRKNMIRSLYPDLYPLCRAELNLKYHFKI